MQHNITCINHRKEENQYTEYQQGKDKSFELQTEAENCNICGANNGKKCNLCRSSNGLIKNVRSKETYLSLITKEEKQLKDK